MLSVTAQDYFVPVKVVEEDQMYWRLWRQNSEEVIATRHFNYTIFVNDGGKMTFTYDENSVKPSPRTLRIYGPMEILGQVVSALSQNTKDGQYGGSFINKILDHMAEN